jgi:hypothetical protein
LQVNPAEADLLKKIEGYRGLCSILTLPSYPNSYKFPLLSASVLSAFPTSESESDTMSEIAKLTATVETLVARIAAMEATLARLATASAAPAVDAAAGGAGKKARKVREPKEKSACPPADTGVVRYFSASSGDFKVFSNFTRAPFTLDGKEYGSVEHYVQSMKFVGSDDAYAEEIRAQPKAAVVRMMGKNKKHPARADWEDVKRDVYLRAFRAKFAGHEELKAKLLSTGTAKIEYEAPDDAYWGIGADGAGENWAGQLLMDVRAELAA